LPSTNFLEPVTGQNKIKTFWITAFLGHSGPLIQLKVNVYRFVLKADYLAMS
jgi:hypothetical protein